MYTKYIVDVTIRGFDGRNELEQVLEVNPLVALVAAFSGEALFCRRERQTDFNGHTEGC